MSPNVLIALTAYGGWTRNACVTSIVRLVHVLEQRGWKYRFHLYDQSDVTQARNSLASLALSDRSVSHLLFVDYDIAFEPESAIRLIESGLPIVGVACRRRQTRKGRVVPDDFNVKPSPHTVPIKGGIIEVAGIGMGLTVITRDTLVAMHASGLLTVQTLHAFRSGTFNDPIYGFFDRILDAGALVGEDYSFCRRWRDLCGGSTFAVIDDSIGHITDAVLTSSLATVVSNYINENPRARLGPEYSEDSGGEAPIEGDPEGVQS